MIPEESHELFRQQTEKAQTLVLVTHIQPDGDALGSEVALARFLAACGKRPRIINNDPTSAVLAFIEDPDNPVEVYDSSRHDSMMADADLIVLVDNSAPDRLGRMEPVITRLASQVLCIDHHPARNAPWHFNIVDVKSCATAVMVHDLAVHNGWRPDPVAALAIYVGLATDTGFFRFNSTNAHAHEIAAALLRIGVQPAVAFRAIHERNTEAYTRLLGHALTDLQLEAGGRLVSVRIKRELLESLNAVDVDTSEITTALLAMDGVQVVLLFRELEHGKVKVSLRSKGLLNVHRLALEFGGGGHRNASGIVMPGSLADVDAIIRDRAVSLVSGSPQS